jgi:hypothetical protein
MTLFLSRTLFIKLPERIMGVVIDIVAILAGLAVGIFSVVKALSGKEAGYLVGVGAGAIVVITGVALLVHHV